MKNFRAALFLPCLLAFTASARADDGMTSFHYMDLYNIEQTLGNLKDLKALRTVMYIASKDPHVMPEHIHLVMHHAGGDEPLQLDSFGKLLLPESDALKQENPLITTDQPKHTLDASVFMDLVPLESTAMPYSALMEGVTQFNQAVDREGKGMMAGILGSKSNGLLLFYNHGGHSVTLHSAKGDRVFKSAPPDKRMTHLKGLHVELLPPGAEVIFVPLESALLKQDPKAALDTLPAQTFPAF